DAWLAGARGRVAVSGARDEIQVAHLDAEGWVVGIRTIASGTHGCSDRVAEIPPIARAGDHLVVAILAGGLGVESVVNPEGDAEPIAYPDEWGRSDRFGPALLWVGECQGRCRLVGHAAARSGVSR